MDFLRQGRFLVPPFLALFSLLIAFLMDGRLTAAEIGAMSTQEVTAAIGLIGAGTLPAGYLLGGISAFLFRGVYSVFVGEGRPDIALSTEAWDKIGKTLNAPVDPSNHLYAGVTFEMQIMSDGVQKWVDRRWDAFNINLNSLVALSFSTLGGFLVFRNYSLWPFGYWLAGMLVLMAMIFFFAWTIWHECMGMIDYNVKWIADGRLDKQPEDF